MSLGIRAGVWYFTSMECLGHQTVTFVDIGTGWTLLETTDHSLHTRSTRLTIAAVCSQSVLFSKCATCLPIKSSLDLIFFFLFSFFSSLLRRWNSLWGLASSVMIDFDHSNEIFLKKLTEIRSCWCSVKAWHSYYDVPYVCCRFWTRWSGELCVQEVIHNRNLYWISNLYWFSAFI